MRLFDFRPLLGSLVAVASVLALGAPGRAHEELPHVGDPRADVAADVVWVVALEVGGRHHRARQHAVAEAWGEPLDLLLDARQHVDI